MRQGFIAAHIFIASLLLSSNIANANSSCWPLFTALNETIDLTSSAARPLISERGDGLFLSDAQVKFTVDNENVYVTAEFTPDSPPLATPYNIFALVVLQNGELIYHEDYTDNCHSTGISFFPRQSLNLAHLKLKNRSKKDLQVILWGR